MDLEDIFGDMSQGNKYDPLFDEGSVNQDNGTSTLQNENLSNIDLSTLGNMDLANLDFTDLGDMDFTNMGVYPGLTTGGDNEATTYTSNMAGNASYGAANLYPPTMASNAGYNGAENAPNFGYGGTEIKAGLYPDPTLITAAPLPMPQVSSTFAPLPSEAPLVLPPRPMNPPILDYPAAEPPFLDYPAPEAPVLRSRRRRSAQGEKISHRRVGKNDPKNDPERYYKARPPIATWRPPRRHRDVDQALLSPPFEYTEKGTLLDKITFDRQRLVRFLRFHPLNVNARRGLLPIRAQGVVLLIQNVPAQAKGRRAFHNDNICRMVNCPYRTIRRGFTQVAIVEDPAGINRGDYDPFHNAFYVHLYCLEQAIYLPELRAHFRLEVDAREFPRETKNPMMLTDNRGRSLANEVERWFANRRRDDGRAKRENPAHEADERYDRDSNASSAMSGSASAFDSLNIRPERQPIGPAARFGSTKLYTHIAETVLARVPLSTEIKRSERGGANLNVHKGNVDIYCREFRRLKELRHAAKGQGFKNAGSLKRAHDADDDDMDEENDGLDLDDGNSVVQTYYSRPGPLGPARHASATPATNPSSAAHSKRARRDSDGDVSAARKLDDGESPLAAHFRMAPRGTNNTKGKGNEAVATRLQSTWSARGNPWSRELQLEREVAERGREVARLKADMRQMHRENRLFREAQAAAAEAQARHEESMDFERGGVWPRYDPPPLPEWDDASLDDAGLDDAGFDDAAPLGNAEIVLPNDPFAPRYPSIAPVPVHAPAPVAVPEIFPQPGDEYRGFTRPPPPAPQVPVPYGNLPPTIDELDHLRQLHAGLVPARAPPAAHAPPPPAPPSMQPPPPPPPQSLQAYDRAAIDCAAAVAAVAARPQTSSDEDEGAGANVGDNHGGRRGRHGRPAREPTREHTPDRAHLFGPVDWRGPSRPHHTPPLSPRSGFMLPPPPPPPPPPPQQQQPVFFVATPSQQQQPAGSGSFSALLYDDLDPVWSALDLGDDATSLQMAAAATPQTAAAATPQTDAAAAGQHHAPQEEHFNPYTHELELRGDLPPLQSMFDELIEDMGAAQWDAFESLSPGRE